MAADLGRRGLTAQAAREVALVAEPPVERAGERVRLETTADARAVGALALSDAPGAQRRFTANPTTSFVTPSLLEVTDTVCFTCEPFDALGFGVIWAVRT